MFENIMKKLPKSASDALNLQSANNQRDKHNLELLNEFKPILKKNITMASKKGCDHFFTFRGKEFLSPKETSEGALTKDWNWIHVWAIKMLIWAGFWRLKSEEDEN